MKYLILLLALSGCATQSLTDRKDSSIHTISVRTGTLGEKLYDHEFKKKAQEICPYGYSVLEKTKNPSTLDESVISEYKYYWVVKCK